MISCNFLMMLFGSRTSGFPGLAMFFAMSWTALITRPANTLGNHEKLPKPEG